MNDNTNFLKRINNNLMFLNFKHNTNYETLTTELYCLLLYHKHIKGHQNKSLIYSRKSFRPETLRHQHCEFYFLEFRLTFHEIRLNDNRFNWRPMWSPMWQPITHLNGPL